ncbi:MAG: hypothetical protein ACPHY9_07440 [Candidatus Puniceispirillaceae bacterium]
MEADHKKKVSDWMHLVMDRMDMTANQWAKAANTSPTNITRFLKPGSKFIPSTRTLAKLSVVAGTSPPFHGTSEQTASFIAIRDRDGETDKVFLSDRCDVQVFRLGYWTGMGARGINSQCLVVVEPRNRISDCRDGDIILYRSRSVGLMCAEYRNGMLVCYPTDATVMPEEFNELGSGFWAPLEAGVIGEKRLIGKVTRSVLQFS